jgi:hypothetical protein
MIFISFAERTEANLVLRMLLSLICQNAFCRRLHDMSPTIVWALSDAVDLQKRVGARVRETRTTRGFSHESFAEACELHRTYVSLPERGRINITLNMAIHRSRPGDHLLGAVPGLN